MQFQEIFAHFLDARERLKVITVASSTPDGEPNGAPKMLVDAAAPNKIYFIEYRHTQTFANLCVNPRLSVAFMDEREFLGFRLNGRATLLEKGEEYENARAAWRRRLARYEVDRMPERIRGGRSSRSAENALPHDFVLVRLNADTAAVVHPDRVLRAAWQEPRGKA
jgi:general stress protein 26